MRGQLLSVTGLTLGLLAGLAAPGTAAATPPPAVAAVDPAAPDTPAPEIDASRFPKTLNRYVQGTKEFQDAYTNIADSRDAIACSKGFGGGSVGRYVDDFTHNFGTIMAATSKATGQPMLTMDGDPDHPVPTTPWDWPADSSVLGPYAPDTPAPGEGDSIAQLDGERNGSPIYASAGARIAPARMGRPGHQEPCAKDYAPYGKADENAPFGFAFYPAPDEGSISYFTAAIAKQGAAGLDPNGYDLEPPSAYWSDRNPMSRWDYSPLDFRDYCSEGNPLCMTATFLHCPATAAAGKEAAVENCRIWNANTILRQNQLAMHLGRPGVGTPADGSPLKVEAQKLLTQQGSQAPLDTWYGLMFAGKKMANGLKWANILGNILVAGIAVVLVAGGFMTGGLLGALVAAGVVVISLAGGPEAWKKMWGVVACGSEPDKCAAQMAAKAMAFSASLVQDAATHTAYPQMTQPTMHVLGRIAGLSGVLMMILFLLALSWALFTGKVGQIIPSSLGLLRWGIAMGCGATLLTLAFTASDLVATAIAGSDTGGPAASLGTLGETATRIAMTIGARAGFLQWLVVALVCLVGAICALIVKVVVYLTSQFIPFVLCVFLLQYAGTAGSEKARSWAGIGWGLLWTILLLRPIIALIGKMAELNSMEEGMQGLITVTTMFVIAALAPGLVARWFPSAAAASMGILQRLGGAMQDIDAGSRVARRMGHAAVGGASRAAMLGRMISNDSSGLGGPGGGAGSVRKAPTGPPTPVGSGGAAGTGGSGQGGGGASGGENKSTGHAAAGTGNAGSTDGGERTGWASPEPGSAQMDLPGPDVDVPSGAPGGGAAERGGSGGGGRPIGEPVTALPASATAAAGSAIGGGPAEADAFRKPPTDAASGGRERPGDSGGFTGGATRGSAGGQGRTVGPAGAQAPHVPAPLPPRHAATSGDGTDGGRTSTKSEAALPPTRPEPDAGGTATSTAGRPSSPAPGGPADAAKPVPATPHAPQPARPQTASPSMAAGSTPEAAPAGRFPGDERLMPTLAQRDPADPPVRGDLGTWAPRLDGERGQPDNQRRPQRRPDKEGQDR